MLSYKKIIFLVFVSVSPILLFGQNSLFPTEWTGRWKGELHWWQGNSAEPKKVNMELVIEPTDSTDKYTWQIIYGKASEDNRPYILLAVDKEKGHWVIDEKNGIILDQYLIANRLSGSFTVQKSTIINNYWMENDSLVAEFYSMGASPVSTTGKGNDEIPLVHSYKINSYQRAVLKRVEKK